MTFSTAFKYYHVALKSNPVLSWCSQPWCSFIMSLSTVFLFYRVAFNSVNSITSLSMSVFQFYDVASINAPVLSYRFQQCSRSIMSLQKCSCSLMSLSTVFVLWCRFQQCSICIMSLSSVDQFRVVIKSVSVLSYRFQQWFSSIM